MGSALPKLGPRTWYCAARTSAPSPITRLIPGPSSLKGITCTWNQVVRGGCIHCSSGPMDEASPIGGWVRTGPGSVTASRTKVERWSMVTTSLPCITCAGSTTMPLGVTTPTARRFRSPPAALSCSGVGFISRVSGVPRVSGVSGVMSMVKGSRVVPLGAVTSLGASLLTETLTCTGKATAVGGKFT